MRDLKSLLANAFARRIAYIIVAAVLGWLGLGNAHAQSLSCNSSLRCTPSEALAECQAYNPVPTNYSIVSVSRRECNNNTESASSGYFVLRYWGLNTNGSEVGAFTVGNFYYKNTCPSEQPFTGLGPWSTSGGQARSGSLGCRNGCDGVWSANADSSLTWSPLGNTCPNDQEKNCQAMGSGYYWNAALKVCEPPENKCVTGVPNSLGQCAPEPCPAGMAQQQDGTCKKKENECPAGNVRSPSGECLPGDGQCAAGETRGADGTCKKDADNDGEPDEGSDGGDDEKKPNEFSGGDDCTRPPSCSGDAIMCGQARIQWRIDCNTRKNRNIAGGMCNAMPVCTGEKCDALEYTQLLMQWRTSCAVEKLANAGASGGGDSEKGIKDHMTALKQAEVNGLRALGQDDGHAGVTADSLWAKPATGQGGLTESMFGGGGGQCSIAFTVMGRAVEPGPDFFNIAALIRFLMIASAYLWVAFKIAD